VGGDSVVVVALRILARRGLASIRRTAC
jgi:hypothetical protein